jgi:hypothetical protein
MKPLGAKEWTSVSEPEYLRVGPATQVDILFIFPGVAAFTWSLTEGNIMPFVYRQSEKDAKSTLIKHPMSMRLKSGLFVLACNGIATCLFRLSVLCMSLEQAYYKS